jgi:hypothetical protein
MKTLCKKFLMMKTLFYASLISFAISFFLLSCTKEGGCGSVLYITKSSVQVIFKDSATNKYLYDEINPLYNKDSIKIYDPQGIPLSLLMSRNSDPVVPTNIYIEINFGSLFDYRTDSTSFTREICKDYVVQYAHNERDTITTCFKSKDLDCGSVFSRLNVFHKGKLLASENNTTNALITVIKN